MSDGPIILLDFDGVIVVPEYYAQPNPDCIGNLVYLIDRTKAKIVVSSAWQVNHPSNEELQAMLVSWGVFNAEVVGKTSDIPHRRPVTNLNYREKQLINYAAIALPKDANWVAIDDSIHESTHPRFVRCQSLVGLTAEISRKAVKVLGV